LFLLLTSSPPQQPIITQSATVTKITFGGAHHAAPVFSGTEAAAKPAPESGGGSSGDKGADILKISMMEAEIDPVVVDSSSDCGPLGKAQAARAAAGSLDPGRFPGASGLLLPHEAQPFGLVQSLSAQRGKEELEVMEVSPGDLEVRWSLWPCD